MEHIKTKQKDRTFTVNVITKDELHLYNMKQCFLRIQSVVKRTTLNLCVFLQLLGKSTTTIFQ
jgi:hypothetical protein